MSKRRSSCSLARALASVWLFLCPLPQVVSGAPAAKGETVPMFFGLHSATDNSSLTMTCAGSAPYQTLSCNFIQVSVRKPSASDIQRSQTELDKTLRTLTMEGFLADQRRQCSEVPEKRAEALRDLEAMKVRYPPTAAMTETWLALCRCPDIQCYRAGLQKALILENDVCTAGADTFQVEFTRVGQARKWMSKAEPGGLCSMATAIVIEEDDKGRWTYTQTRLTLDQTLPVCRDLQPNQKVVYSLALSPGVTGCRVVAF